MVNATQTSGTITFKLRSDKNKKGLKSIILDYSRGRNVRLRYSTGYAVNPEYWDNDKQRVRNVIAVPNRYKINDRINELESGLRNFVEECDARHKSITNPVLKDHIDVLTNKKSAEDDSKIKLLWYIEKIFIPQKEKTLPQRQDSRILKIYRQTLKQLQEFQEDTGFKLEFDNIDREFYAEFVEYMNNKQYGKKVKKNYSLNTIGKYIKTLKTFMNTALYEDCHTNIKFKKFKVLVEETMAISLSLEEQEKMLKLDLSNKPHLELARDIFIIGCEIGQRIGDYQDLSKHEVTIINSEEFLKIKQEKTGKKVLCKITPAIKKIMDERYNGQLLPKIAEQKLNDYIKIVGEIAEIDEQVKDERTIGGEKQVIYHPKYSLIMGHTARRSFCTIKYMASIPVDHIMELSGHSSHKEFRRYIRNPREQRVAKITSTKEFKEASLKIK